MQDNKDEVYIPKDLEDCLIYLDSFLEEDVKNSIKSLDQKIDILRYHHGLGTFMRNSWGLWSGSRLQTYFIERGVTFPDNMSAVILDNYYEWLKGNTDSWEYWELENEVIK